MNNVMKKTWNLTTASLLVAALLASLTPAAAAPATLDNDVVVDVKVDGQSIMDGDTVWFNSLTGQDVTIEVMGSAAAGNSTEVVFSMLSWLVDPKVFNFTDIVTPTFTPAWHSGLVNDGGDDDHNGVRWNATAATVGCGLIPGVNPCPDGIGPGETAIFGVSLVPEALADQAAQAFAVAVMDSQGVAENTASHSISFGIDVTDPVVALAFADGNGNTDDSSFHNENGAGPGVTFTFSDALSGIAFASITLNGNAVACTTSPCTVGMSSFVDGVNTLVASATDAAGNTNGASMTVKIDRNAPTTISTVTLASPNAAEWYNEVPTVTLSASDGTGNVAGVDGIQYKWNADDFAAYTVALTPPVQGVNTLSYFANDNAHTSNAETTQTETFQVDTVDPVLSLAFSDGVDPTDLGIYHSETGATPGVTFTFSDATSTVAAVTFELNGNDVAGCLATAGSCTLNLADLPQGINTVTASVTDVAGNMASSQLTIKIDRTGPTTTISAVGTQGANGWFIAAPTVSIAVSDGTGDVAGADETTWTWTGATTTSGTGNDPGVPEQGVSTLTASATDLAHTANTGAEDSFEVKFDMVKPASTISVEAGPLGPLTSVVDYSCTATDATSLVASVQLYYATGATAPAALGDYSTSGVPVTCDGSPQTFELATVTGLYHFVTIATDNAGNAEDFSAANVDSVLVDLTAPTATVALASGQPFAGSATAIDLEIASSDADTSLSSLVIESKTGAGDWQVLTEAPAFNVADEAAQTVSVDLADFLLHPDGSYLLRVTATDEVGNTFTSDGALSYVLDTAVNPFTFAAIPAFLGPIDLTAGDYTVSGTVEDGASVEVTLNAGTPAAASVVGGAWNADITPGTNAPQTVDATAQDGVLNTAGPLSQSFRVDTLAPSVAASVPTGLTVGGLGTVTFTVTDDASGSGPEMADSDVDLDGASGALVTVVDDHYDVDLSAITTDGTYTVVVNAKDAVGNAANPLTWTVTLSSAVVTTPVITSASPTFTYLAVNNNGPHEIIGTVANGWEITGYTLSNGVSTGTGTTCASFGPGGLSEDASVFGGATTGPGQWTLEVTGLSLSGAAANRECSYTLTVTAEDVFGNAQSDVLNLRRLPVKTLDVALTASDHFHAVGGVVNLLVTVTEDGTATPQPNVRVRYYSDAGTPGELDAADSFINVRTTNSLGQATLPVGTAIAASGNYKFLAVPIEQLVSGVGFRPVVQDALGQDAVAFTRLVADGSLASDADAYLRGDAATFTQHLKWEHDNSPATGLSTVGGVSYPQVAGNSLQLAIDGTSDTLLGSLMETATDGEYTATYASPTAQVLDFLATGSAIAYKGSSTDPASTFALATQPTLADLPWVTAAAQIVLSNADDATDSTGGFLNEDDTLRVAVSLVTSPPGVSVTAPVITLYDDSMPGANVIDSCADGDVCDADGAANGIVAFDIDAGALDPFFMASATQNFAAFPTSFVVAGETITPDEASVQDWADFGADEKATFTGVDVTIDTESILGEEDFAAGRIWANADDFVPGGLGVNSNVDEVTIPVMADWRHDGANAASALLRLVDGLGAPILDDAGVEVTATTDASGSASFTLDPDNFGGPAGTIDYLVNEIQVELVSVPEPTEAGHSDPSESITFQEAAFVPGLEAVWSRVVLDVELNEADEAYLRNGVPTQRVGDELTVEVTPRYLLDEDQDQVNDVVEGNTLFDITLTDSVAAEPAITLTKANPNAVVPLEGLTTFDLARGCTDPSSLALCEGSRAVDEAGFHNFAATAADIPHGLTLNYDVADYNIDLLWTGIALDATTDRITQTAGSGIEYSVRAYYAHGYDAAGAAIALEDRIYPNDVEFTFNGMTHTVGASAAYAETITETAAGATTETAVCVPIVGGPTDDCVVELVGTSDADYIDIVASSASLERRWLDLELAYANVATDDFLDMPDRLVLRGDNPTLAFTAAVLDDGSTAVTDVYAGYSFAPTDNAPAGQMPDRVHADDAKPLGGQTPFTVGFYAGETLVASTTAATYNTMDSRWEATVPDAATTALTDDAGLEVRVTANLQVRDVEATSVGDAKSSADGLVVTAVNLVLDATHPAADDGVLWLNLGDDATIDVTATWAHDGSAVTGASFSDIFGVDTPLVASDGLTLDDGEYTITLPSTVTSDAVTFQVVATAGTSLLDDGVADKGFTDLTGIVLTNTDIDQDAIFTQLVFSTSESDKTINVNDVAELSFDLVWEHDGTIPDFANLEFDVDTGYGPLTQAGDFAEGNGFVVLSSAESQVLGLPTPSVVLAEHGITAIVSGGAMPELTWTQLIVGTIVLDPAPSVGDGVTEATAYQYAIGDSVGFTVPILFEGVGTPATGVTAAFLGYLIDDADDGAADGSIEQAVNSGVQQTIPVDIQPIEAMLGGTQITSSTGSQVIWLDFS